MGLPSCIFGRPEIPAEKYGPPAAPAPAPSPQYLPAVESAKQFAPKQTYGPPPPPQEYGPPPQPQKLVTKNVYIHVPPPERQEYQPAQVLEVPIPKKHYKIIFIKVCFVRLNFIAFRAILKQIYLILGSNSTNTNCTSYT